MTTCPECGFLHPLTPGGCPIARSNKRSSTSRGRAINNLIKAVTNHLEKVDDWEDKIKNINKVIGG